MRTPFSALLAGMILPLIVGCASTGYREWVPPETLAKVDQGLTFKQLKESPDAQKGKMLFLGGEVLTAKRLQDHTRLVILQLPLDDYDEPVLDRQQSQGRFIAQEYDFLDPAVVAPGTRLTIVGSVTGSQTKPLDEMDYTYPTITIEHLKIWPKASGYRHYPYWYPPYWYGTYYWPPYYYFGPFGNPWYYW